MAGCFIAFEGIDGTGKSTQVSLLADVFREAGQTVVVTREPTNGQYGRQIRDLSTRGVALEPQDELEYFEQDRREHVDTLISPALERGEVVLTDRYFLSTAAYQGARGLNALEILERHESLFPVPDVVILIDLLPSKALMRVDQRGDARNRSYEQEDFLIKASTNFHRFDRDYLCTVDGDAEAHLVHADVCAQLKNHLRISPLLKGHL